MPFEVDAAHPLPSLLPHGESRAVAQDFTRINHLVQQRPSSSLSLAADGLSIHLHRRPVAQRLVRALLVEEDEVAADAIFRQPRPVVRVEEHLLVFQRAPEPLDEDVVQAAALAVHRDPNAPRLENFGDLAGQQLVWWSAVGLVVTGHELVATLPALAYVAVSTWANGRRALALAMLGALIGFFLDTALVRAGAIRFQNHPGGLLTTPWMVGLWATFGVAFSASMAWLSRRGWRAALLFGAVAGVLAYRSGAALGVLALGPGSTAYLLIGAGWALAVRLLHAAAAKLAPQSNAGREAALEPA
jgi:hypothetical protein